MTNEELLKWSGGRSRLLTNIENQKRFILQQAARPNPCPNCFTPVNQFDAAGVTVNDFDVESTHADYAYHCPACKRKLRFLLPLFGSWHWGLAPIDPATGKERQHA